MATGPGEQVRAMLSPLASPSALSWTTVLLAAPLIFAIQVPGNAAFGGGAFGGWALACAVGLLVVAGLFAAVTVVTATRDPSVAAVLVTYLVAALAQPVVFGLVTVGSGLTADAQLTLRLTGPLVYVPVLIAAGLAVATHAAHRRVIAELEQKRARLLDIGPSLESELDRAQAELVAAVRTSLEPALASLDAALATAAGRNRADDAIGALNDIVERDLRPLSRALVADRSDGTADEPPAEAPAKVPLPRRFALARGVRPGLASLVVLIGAVPTGIRDLGPTEGLTWVAGLTLACWAGLTLVRRLMARREVRTPLGVAVIVSLHMFVMAFALWLLVRIGIAIPYDVTASGIAFLGVVGALTVGSMLVGERRAESELELAAATERLERAVALTLRRERLVRRRAAFVLHGSLQGALHAAALRIAEGKAIDRDLVDDVRADIHGALSKLDATSIGGSACRTQIAINDLAEVWQGHRTVTARMGPGVIDALRADPDADEALAEVVREAVNNAFRHGVASTVDLDAHLAPVAHALGQPAIVIVARDDGRGPPAETSPGLGTVLFDDVCRSWKYSARSDGSTFRAELSLAPRFVAQGTV